MADQGIFKDRCQMQFPFAERKLAAINEHTIYDVPRKLESLARNIRDGQFGKVTDIVAVLRCRNGESFAFEGFQYGPSPADTAVFMLEKMKDQILKYNRR